MHTVPENICIKGDINTLSSRQAMGLNEGFVPLCFDDIDETFDAFRGLSKESLVRLINDRANSLKERFAIGQLLALIGDTRIKTLQPQMRIIPTANVSIGLEKKQVENVVSKYKSVGVLDDWIKKETPRFSVHINTYSMAVFPVTNKEYRDYLSDEQSGEIPSSWTFGRYPNHLSNHPVATISDVAAVNYTKWLSRKTGRRFRLPTEIEWEYAAAGVKGLEFPWGNEYVRENANTAELGIFATTTVGIFLEGSSPFGLLDMAGNVEEYTSSDYWVYPGGDRVEDDLLTLTKSYKIARGGSCTRFSDLARCRRRHGRYSKDIYVMGFRLAEDSPSGTDSG